eukprot:CAMPEP_0113907538 /NCGR_PEP_ID=MMETSP0780_2-20120614/25545_1 /TAXON_ID=652834 /ORGANISM="Palpitomonas bilix" /LENGTH=762 /DNA_ID=CAMNT_0000902633 /DNA_START=301 /DNA_END=2592 /DNA_ORIENTATION=- /assembly_acc=CAM_ASM_000599
MVMPETLHVSSPSRTASIYRQRLLGSSRNNSPTARGSPKASLLSGSNSPSQPGTPKNSGKKQGGMVRGRRNSLEREALIRNAYRRNSITRGRRGSITRGTAGAAAPRRNSIVRGLKVDTGSKVGSPVSGPPSGIRFTSEGEGQEEDEESAEIKKNQIKWKQFLPGFYEQTLSALGTQRRGNENNLIMSITTKLKKRIRFIQHDMIKLAGRDIYVHSAASKGGAGAGRRPGRRAEAGRESDSIPVSVEVAQAIDEKLDTYVKSIATIIRDEIHKSTDSEKAILEGLLKTSVGELDHQHNILVKLYEKKLDSTRIAAEMTIKSTQIRMDEDWRIKFDALRESLKRDFGEEKESLFEQIASLQKTHQREKAEMANAYDRRLEAELEEWRSKKDLEKQPLQLRIQELEREAATMERKMLAARVEAQEKIAQATKTVSRLEHDVARLNEDLSKEQERTSYETTRLKQEIEKMKKDQPAGWERLSEAEKKDFIWRLKREKLRGVFQESQHKKVIDDLQTKYRLLQRKVMAMYHERKSTGEVVELDPVLQGLLQSNMYETVHVHGTGEGGMEGQAVRPASRESMMTPTGERGRLPSPSLSHEGDREVERAGQGPSSEVVQSLPAMDPSGRSSATGPPSLARSQSLNEGRRRNSSGNGEDEHRAATHREEGTPKKEQSAPSLSRRQQPQPSGGGGGAAAGLGRMGARAGSYKVRPNSSHTVPQRTVAKNNYTSPLSILPEGGMGISINGRTQANQRRPLMVGNTRSHQQR